MEGDDTLTPAEHFTPLVNKIVKRTGSNLVSMAKNMLKLPSWAAFQPSTSSQPVPVLTRGVTKNPESEATVEWLLASFLRERPMYDKIFM